jgi:hypothetical protein
MVTIVWNPKGSHIIGVLPSEHKFSSSSDIQQNEILGSVRGGQVNKPVQHGED